MAYVDVHTIVAGAVEEERTFYDETLLNEWLREIEEDAANTGYKIEVFAVFHEHGPVDECSCVQHLTDHKPYRTYNANGAT